MGGTFVSAARSLPLGTSVAVEFRLGGRVIRLQAQVMHTCGPGGRRGFGLQFSDYANDVANELAAIIRRSGPIFCADSGEKLVVNGYRN